MAASPLNQHFASDNNAGICPEAMRALVEADASGHEPSYGEDRWTRLVCDRIRDLFQTDCEVFFVFNGTAANALSLAALCQSYQAVICHEVAHVEADECGAPEFFSNGSKLLLVQGPNGKVTPDALDKMARKRTDLHFPKAKAVTLTQSTEVGTVYTVEELHALAAIAKCNGLKVHMDGARFANAVAKLDVHPSEITWRAGVDVLSLGGTKNGLAVGEAVVFFNKALAEDFAWRAKQAGQLASKMRFISAPWLGLLDNDVLAEERAPRQRHGQAPARPAGQDSRCADHVRTGSKRRVRRVAAETAVGRARGRLAILYLHRRGRLPADDRLGHLPRNRRPLRRRREAAVEFVGCALAHR